MNYFLSFLEGIITFISPCLLPMLPIYIAYFAGDEGGRARTLRHVLGFVLGFTTVFVALGVFASLLGGLLRQWQTALNLITGGIVILIGLHYLGVLRLPFLSGGGSARRVEVTSTASAYLFGLVFSVSWTPCVGAFLGSALMLAGQSGTLWQGVALLLCYCAGLGIPFLISALLIDQLKGAFSFINRHYTLINRICGGFLILVGLLMASGLLGRFLNTLSIL